MKILLHAHTIYSDDGELTPLELAVLARRRGFQVVMLSDHFEHLHKNKYYDLVNDCRSIKKCVMVPGYERDWYGYHILALGLYNWVDDDCLENWAHKVHHSGAITVLAHPSRYRHNVPEAILAICDGIEVWNSKRSYDGLAGPNPQAYQLLGSGRYPVCGQDFHGLRHLSSVAVQTAEQVGSVDEVIKSFKQGKYYMTNNMLVFRDPLTALANVNLRVFHLMRRMAVDALISALKVSPRLSNIMRFYASFSFFNR